MTDTHTQSLGNGWDARALASGVDAVARGISRARPPWPFAIIHLPGQTRTDCALHVGWHREFDTEDCHRRRERRLVQRLPSTDTLTETLGHGWGARALASGVGVSARGVSRARPPCPFAIVHLPSSICQDKPGNTASRMWAGTASPTLRTVTAAGKGDSHPSWPMGSTTSSCLR